VQHMHGVRVTRPLRTIVEISFVKGQDFRALTIQVRWAFADSEGPQWLLGELFVFYPHVGKFSKVLIERGHLHVLSRGGRGD
jgi:hypothetical protein